MMLAFVVSSVLAGAPLEWLEPNAGLARLFPDEWREVLQRPDSVVLEGLKDLTPPEAAPFGPEEMKVETRWTRELTDAKSRALVAGFLAQAARWKVSDPRRCRQKRCVFVLSCGGYRPHLRVTLTKGERRASAIIQFGCDEVWVLRTRAESAVGREQAMLVNGKAWLQFFAPLTPEGDVIRTFLVDPFAATATERRPE